MNSKTVNILVSFVKYGIVIAAVSYLILSGKLDISKIDFIPSRIPYILFAMLLYLIALVSSFVRWDMLLRGLDIQLPRLEVVRLGSIGAFFNTFLFGGLGGDVVKLGYVVRKTHKRGPAAASVVVDRISGLTGLMIVGGVAIMLSWQSLTTPGLRLLAVVLFTCLASLGIGLLAFFVAVSLGRIFSYALIGILLAAQIYPMESPVLKGLFDNPNMEIYVHIAVLVILASALLTTTIVPGMLPGRGLEGFILRRIPLGGKLLSFTGGLLAYRHHPGTLLASLICSIITQLCSLLAIASIAYAVGNPATVSQILFAAPVAVTANIIPVPLGGLGVGEAVFANLLNLCNDPEGMAIQGGALVFLSFRIIINLVNVTCGLPFYLTHKQEIKDMKEEYETTDNSNGEAHT